MNDFPLIRFEDVSCSFAIRRSRLRYKNIEVLSNINLLLHKGETLGIIGHNGAGKSTLLQVFANILTPTEGKVYWRDDLNIFLLTLQLGFAQELTGRENAVLGAMFLGYSRQEAEARLDKILDYAEIGHWADDPMLTYSTGMKARLGFAVAMEMEPDVMLIDETLGVGDAYFYQKSSRTLMDKMRSGLTTILVSHNAGTMKQLCSRVVWLHAGRIHKEGAPAEVLQEYAAWIATLARKSAGARV